MSAFDGVPLAAIDFYEDLERDNSREWWQAQRARYTDDVRAPMEALAAVLEEEFGSAKVFRPNRDVRFSADKSPYKTHQGFVVPLAEGIGWYVQVSAEGLMTAGGWWRGTPEMIAAYRAALLEEEDHDAGEELERILQDLREAGYAIGGDRLRTKPRGVAAEHPFLDLLRHRSLTAERQHGEPEWLPTPGAAERVAADWRAYRPLMQWLAANVSGTDRP
ncbi:DUF2461 domain-containing protein [Tessaracoccus rhinocerotis]|uniref:DUF2461 domain-containing protein n=1 Tax=Tessaracoccus rhinocerotis TaxID=1689449 RepID=A0A553K6A7_9ACTN|nr:DUF2461 domain-containing protein [Tessaracoccus rhinocerotis]TRY20234.1 DUF2461 domain-containing protein [Tessaracoccus rhinocerotis]